MFDDNRVREVPMAGPQRSRYHRAMTRDADPSDRVPPVEVSRRIEAPAPRIFAVLANPSNHVVLDGSGTVRGVVSDSVISSGR